MKGLNGARAVVESLKREGVAVVFGYPGGAVLDIYDALLDSGIRHILTRHEQAAAHAADGYARAAGRTGVVLTTSGPGATNLVTGLMTAYLDSSPIVALTGQVAAGKLGTDSFQEADITGITLPAAKHSYLVKATADLPRVVREAFHIAASGRHGPVLIDMPRDVLAGPVERFEYPATVKLRGYKPPARGHRGHPLQVRRAAQALARANRPVILVGGGVVASQGSAQVLCLAELVQAPVTGTLMGLGGFPGDHPRWLGMAGMHGTVAANRALQEADVLLAVGVRFEDRLVGRADSFAPNATIIHVDIDAAEVGKNVRVDVPIVGDAGAVLDFIRECWLEGPEVPDPAGRAAELRQWLERIEGWQQEHPLPCGLANGKVKPQAVIQALHRLAPEATVVTDVGQNQMWAAQHFRFTRPRTLITSGGLGTMGFGLPAAVGAQIARPGEPVVVVCGDGGFLMNCQELATVAEHGLPVKVFVLNNGFLGMVRQWQEAFYAKRYSSVHLANPDFVLLSQAFGVPAKRVEAPGELEDAVALTLATDGPALLDCRVDPEENVLPFIPPNRRPDAGRTS